jgi:hypothetical protein
MLGLEMEPCILPFNPVAHPSSDENLLTGVSMGFEKGRRWSKGVEGWKVIIRDTYQYEQLFLIQVVASKVQYIVTAAPPHRAV